MSWRRRKFLLLGGLTGLGVTALGKALISGALQGGVASSPTHPLPALSTPVDQLLLRFIAIADSGAGDRNQFAVGSAIANFHQKNPFTLAVMAGDNIYDRGEISRVGVTFEQPYKALLQRGVKFRAALGNHDIRTENGDPQVRYPGFNMAGRYYTYQIDSVQFFVLDTNGNADWKNQLAWLEQELRQSQALWKIVYGHHPIYASGHYGTNAEFVKIFTPLFKQYGVNLYINGHEHHYERTAAIDGTTYLITGNAGAHLRSVGRSRWTELAVSQFGFSALEVSRDRILIQAIDRKGQVFDRGFVIRD
ncbi:MAG: metallophosphoesterase [Synechococcales bacterium]|nr:metallophosphoesterase [Synechococcales bacterium]